MAEIGGRRHCFVNPKIRVRRLSPNQARKSRRQKKMKLGRVFICQIEGEDVVAGQWQAETLQRVRNEEKSIDCFPGNH